MLQTTLTAQEAILVQLRRTLRLPLDDLLAVTREFLSDDVSRSWLDRCLPDESRRRYLFVAIDRATRWVFVAIKNDKTAASACSFLNALHKARPSKIFKLLTDNGKEFADRLFASREREPSGKHEFDRLRHKLGIGHRLTSPRTPKNKTPLQTMKDWYHSNPDLFHPRPYDL